MAIEAGKTTGTEAESSESRPEATTQLTKLSTEAQNILKASATASPEETLKRLAELTIKPSAQ